MMPIQSIDRQELLDKHHNEIVANLVWIADGCAKKNPKLIQKMYAWWTLLCLAKSMSTTECWNCLRYLKYLVKKSKEKEHDSDVTVE